MSPRLNKITALEAANLMAGGSASSEAIVAACLERIDERDQAVMAWTSLDEEKAILAAKQADQRPVLSRLHGIPVGVKDVIDTAELPTQYNSPIYQGHRPRADAACVALLKRAGCIILGKTATTEFANIHPTHTRNPANLEHTPGGSSSGSAAAIADFMVPIAIGTQTAGSVIRPAIYCGDFALKPTFGQINRAGMKMLAESLDTIGIFARDPADLEAVFEILSGRTPVPDQTRRPRVGLWRTRAWDRVDPPTQTAIEKMAERLEDAGAHISFLNLPSIVDELSDIHKVVMGFESARALAWEYETFPEKISAALHARLTAGWAVTRTEYDHAMWQAESGRRALAAAMESCDFIVTPAAPGVAPTMAQTGDSQFNRVWTLLGNPCLAVPSGKTEAGLPVGLQLVGAIGADMDLLAWGKWVRATLMR